MKFSKAFLLAVLLVALCGVASASDPKLDPKRIINESNSFLKEREPEMTEEEYALYQKVVTMLSSNPEFALKLLEAMMSDKEPPTPHLTRQFAAQALHRRQKDGCNPSIRVAARIGLHANIEAHRNFARQIRLFLRNQPACQQLRNNPRGSRTHKRFGYLRPGKLCHDLVVADDSFPGVPPESGEPEQDQCGRYPHEGQASTRVTRCSRQMETISNSVSGRSRLQMRFIP